MEVLVDLRHRARTALDHVHLTVHGPERELVLERRVVRVLEAASRSLASGGAPEAL